MLPAMSSAMAAFGDSPAQPAPAQRYFPPAPKLASGVPSDFSRKMVTPAAVTAAETMSPSDSTTTPSTGSPLVIPRSRKPSASNDVSSAPGSPPTLAVTVTACAGPATIAPEIVMPATTTDMQRITRTTTPTRPPLGELVDAAVWATLTPWPGVANPPD